MTGIDTTTFEAEVDRAGDRLSPVRAGLLLARECAYPDLRPSECLAQLKELAAEVRPRLAAVGHTADGGIALAEYLFQTAGFRGNAADYSDPRNSYLNQVLERRLGLPITLSVIFLEVARQVGVPAAGVGLPGHFIVSIAGEDGPVFLDPFNSGQMLTVAECAALAQRVVGPGAAFEPGWLDPTPPRDIVTRMLNNLRGFYVSMEDWAMAIRVLECLRAVQPAVVSHLRDLGALHYRNGAIRRASDYFSEYLRRSPGASDSDAVRQGRDRMWVELARLN